MKIIRFHVHLEQSVNPGGKKSGCSSFKFCISFQEVGSAITTTKKLEPRKASNLPIITDTARRHDGARTRPRSAWLQSPQSVPSLACSIFPLPQTYLNPAHVTHYSAGVTGRDFGGPVQLMSTSSPSAPLLPSQFEALPQNLILF